MKAKSGRKMLQRKSSYSLWNCKVWLESLILHLWAETHREGIDFIWNSLSFSLSWANTAQPAGLFWAWDTLLGTDSALCLDVKKCINLSVTINYFLPSLILFHYIQYILIKVTRNCTVYLNDFYWKWLSVTGRIIFHRHLQHLEISQRSSSAQAWPVTNYRNEFCEAGRVYQDIFSCWKTYWKIPEMDIWNVKLETNCQYWHKVTICFSLVDIRLLARTSQTVYIFFTSSQAASGFQWKTEHLSAFLYPQLSSPYALTEVKKTSKSN